MKKTYLIPTLKVVKIETKSIMAGSIVETNAVEVGDSWTSGSAGSRRGNLWDDDDDE